MHLLFMHLFLLFLLFLLFCQIQGLIFYYDTTTSNLDTIEYKYKNYNNSDIFVFLPGTNAFCEDYTQLFYTINNRINVLCINYKNDMKSSIKYYKYNSFQNKSKSLEKPLYQALEKINNISGMNYINKVNNKPAWDKIVAGGHSQASVIVTGWAKIHKLARLVLFSGPGCQFGKRLHNWIKSPFATENNRIYGIESLQDKILPWYYGNKDFGCKKEDGISSYIKSLGINLDKIQTVSLSNKIYIKKDIQIILLNMRFYKNLQSHLFTCINMKTRFNYFRKQLWLYSILDN